MDPTFRRIAAAPTLAAAWRRVRRNDGAAGIDRVSIDAFAADGPRRLAGLRWALLRGTYRPRRVLPVTIAKPSGGVRQLMVPTLVDRIAQAAAGLVLDGLLDAAFSDASFAYRRGRSVGHALGRVLTYRLWGFAWAFDTDIAAFFDTIPHAPLIAELGARVDSPATLDLVRLWLGQSPHIGVGVLQGGPISPLLANLYLDPVDHAIDGRRVRLVRYADNILLLTQERGTAERAGARLAALLAARGLALSPAKTRLVPLDEHFTFLGYRIGALAPVRDPAAGPPAAPEDRPSP